MLGRATVDGGKSDMAHGSHADAAFYRAAASLPACLPRACSGIRTRFAQPSHDWLGGKQDSTLEFRWKQRRLVAERPARKFAEPLA